MTVRRRRSDRSGRSKLHSPGRPDSARREELVRFWASDCDGRSSEDAARDAGVSPPVGSRWFRRSGGMPPSHLSQSASRCQDVTCLSRNVRRLLFCAPREEAYAILLAGWSEHRRRSPARCGATRRPEAVAWTTEQRRRSGILIDPPKGRSQPSWQRMRRCGATCRIGLRVGSRHRMER